MADVSRRSFLKILGAVMAATTLDQVAAIVPVPEYAPVVEPVIDWNTWTTVRLNCQGALPEWSINGILVNRFPKLVKVASVILSAHGSTTSNISFSNIDDVEIQVCRAMDPRGRGHYLGYQYGTWRTAGTLPAELRDL